MAENLSRLSAAEMALRIRQGSLSPTEVIDEHLRILDERNNRTNSVITVFEEDARRRAREAEHAINRGKVFGPLHGVPTLIKDLAATKAGTNHTRGSIPLQNVVSDDTSIFVERLENAGSIILGKTNLCEFGYKATTDNSLFGPTSTPFDLDRNAGGSSGGSAAAVADGIVPIAQGSDGGGSIRIPAAWCGVYGFKATYKRVAKTSRPNGFSITPYSHAGPITRTVEDAAIMLEVMAGPHKTDPLSLPDDNIDFVGAVFDDIDNFRIAYSPSFGIFPIDERVRLVVDDAVVALEEAGATVEEIELSFKQPQSELADLWLREMGVLLNARFDTLEQQGIDIIGDNRDEVDPELLKLVERASNISALDYLRDESRRTMVYDVIQRVFDSYDILATPTVAIPPVKNADNGNTLGPTEVGGEEVDPLIGWCPTYLTNFTGHPSASVPAGLTNNGLPIGMQLIGDRFADDDVLAASAAFERLRPWHEQYPYLKK